LLHHRNRAAALSTVAGALTLCAARLVLAQTAPTVDFQREIRPILSDNCFQCHGPDGAARQAGLRLDRRESALEARPNGAPIVPGKSADSLLFQRITDPDPNLRMPPADSHKRVTPAQIALLKRWIDAGAPWKEHWAFQTPVKPTPPTVKDAAWGRNSIDAFILAKLEEKGLAPAPAENQRALIRRVALDTTGLPPKPAEVETFLQDTSPNAYERMVDRYLASPHYGEHRARYWLDAARYGDTHGIHVDNYREIWPYRDWVIAAFNRNLPFDQFTIEQLAGDLLPNPTLDQRIATGFQRCNVTTNEVGIIDDEYAEIYAKDRADTVGAVWLAMTVGCATCHDHKFDPISQKDFYALGAFFRNTTQKVMDGNISDTPPILLVPRAADRAAWEQKNARLPVIRAEMDQTRQSAAAAFEQWLRERRPEPSAQPLENSDDAFTPALPEPLQFERTGGHTLAKAPKADAEKSFSISIRFQYPQKDQNYTLAGQQNTRDRNRGWVADITARQIGFRLIGDNGAAIEARAADAGLLQPGSSNLFVATYDGSRNQSGLMLYLNGSPVALQGLGARNARLNGGIETEDGIILGRFFAGGAISDFRLFHRVLSEADARLLTVWPATAAALAQPTADNTPAARQTLLDWYLARTYDPYRKLTAEQHRLNLDLRAIASRGATTLVMEERAGQKPFAFTLYRGAYDQKRDRVEAATPTVLPPMAAALPRNRLGFARWLFTEDHPLTARVAVNRMWQEIFGVGLVKTADDFGSQGEPPTHPQLLDWLAVDFRESNWDVKRFYRQVLNSAAYREMALTTPEKLAKDPENRLLSRGPRFRMDAEMLRDYALAASGLLAPQTGGPSVKPYQPEGVWEAVAMDGSNTRFYKPDTGTGLYRRSFYTFWKRSAPPASMDVFNAPTRESCVVRRERTDTPLQALAAMNDVQFVEAARVLAESAMQSTSAFDARLDYITARVLARPLAASERLIARHAYTDIERYYSAHPDDARKFLDDGERKPDPGLAPSEHAALTMLASQLLNLDEVLNK
jgi:mono/diheme cytochrome c family protein